MNFKKAITGHKSLVILLILAIGALYLSLQYHYQVRELNLLEERLVEVRTEQDLMFRVLESNMDETELEKMRRKIEEASEVENPEYIEDVEEAEEY